MRWLIVTCVGLTLGWAEPAAARFVLQQGPAPVPVAETLSPLVGEAKSPRAKSVQRRAPIARGFGDDVPLGFAVRQMAPPGWKVRYGRGVDRAALVTWRGGRAWDRALKAAVAPLGLRVRADGRRITIEQARR